MTVDARRTLELELRTIGLADVAAAAAVHVAAFGASGPDALERAMASLAEEVARPWSRVLVAWSGLEAVGLLVGWHVADEVEILDVATHPTFRRRGVGRKLVDAALQFARANRANRVHLEVRRSNAAAIALYELSGFVVVGVRTGYYPDYEDALAMTRSLDPVDADGAQTDD